MVSFRLAYLVFFNVCGSHFGRHVSTPAAVTGCKGNGSVYCRSGSRRHNSSADWCQAYKHRCVAVIMFCVLVGYWDYSSSSFTSTFNLSFSSSFIIMTTFVLFYSSHPTCTVLSMFSSTWSFFFCSLLQPCLAFLIMSSSFFVSFSSSQFFSSFEIYLFLFLVLYSLPFFISLTSSLFSSHFSCYFLIQRCSSVHSWPSLI